MPACSTPAGHRTLSHSKGHITHTWRDMSACTCPPSHTRAHACRHMRKCCTLCTLCGAVSHLPPPTCPETSLVEDPFATTKSLPRTPKLCARAFRISSLEQSPVALPLRSRVAHTGVNQTWREPVRPSFEACVRCPRMGMGMGISVTTTDNGMDTVLSGSSLLALPLHLPHTTPSQPGWNQE